MRAIGTRTACVPQQLARRVGNSSPTLFESQRPNCRITRSRRRKCEFDSPGIGCAHCIRRGFQCSLLTVSPTVSGELSTPFTSPHGNMRIRDLTVELPPQSLCEELVDLYFRFIHDTFHSLFHYPTMMEDVSQGTVPPVILYAMISLSARSV